MENENEIIKTTAFVSKGYGEGRRVSRGFSERMGFLYKASRGKKGADSRFILIRLGVCAAAFMGILGIKLAVGGGVLAAANDISDKRDTGTNTEESLGKLKFVELPSIIEVFAPSDAAVLPAAVLSFEMTEEGVTLVTTAGAEVVSPVDGSIRDVGEDRTLGKYITVSADGDIELVLYGFGDIDVEKGQPVRKRQKLGTTLGSALSIKAFRAGRPIDVSDILDFGKAG